jgi:hypothetical protein
MPITSNATTNMSRRQAFNGKGLTFIECIFNDGITSTASTPDTKDSTFQKVRDAVLNTGTLLAQSYRLAAKATDDDASEVAQVTANDSIDSYQFIVEGTPGQFNDADSAGDINLDPDQAAASDPGVIAAADIETDILARIDVGDSAGAVQVKVRFLPADGVTSAGVNAVFGMFDQRGDA